MRLHIKCTSNTIPLNFDYQNLLTGVIHKWLGQNGEHGELSLYSFSLLTDGEVIKGKLCYPRGSEFFISTYNPSIQMQIIEGIKKSPELFNGMKVKEVIIQETPDFSNTTFFKVASPIFIKRKIGENIKHITYEDELAGKYLEETLRTKMNTVGLVDDSLKIEFVRDYRGAKQKLVKYREVANKVSWCPVNIVGKPETKAFAWEVGLGNSTGVGFGAIK